MLRIQRAATASITLSFLALTACEKKPEPKPEDHRQAAAPTAATASAPVEEAPKEPEKPKRPEKPLNVIMLTIDAMRADMPWQGYDKAIAPNLTDLAKESVVYENHRSVSSYTAQTVATLMSGQYASTLYRTGTFFTNYFDSNEWITEAMQDKGITTMAVQAHLYFDRAKGLRQGFDIWRMVPGLTWNAQTDESVTSDRSIPAIIDLLSDEKNVKGQFFLWSHLMDPHDQYVRHEESPDFGKDNRGRYDSEIWYTDHWIGKFLDFAKQQPWWENTALIVSADHGETFGEHGMYKHAFEIWDVLTRVPLIVKAPGAEPKRIEEPRTHIDIAPTIVDLMGMKPLEGFQGQSLVPEIYGAEEPKSREPIVTQLTEDTNNPERRAIVVGDYKLVIYDTGWKKLLFNLKDDPAEENDLSEKEPEKLKEMEAKLKAAFDALPIVRPAGGNKMKSGKVADGPKGPPKDAPKPKGSEKSDQK